jgi:hypothetical protein
VPKRKKRKTFFNLPKGDNFITKDSFSKGKRIFTILEMSLNQNQVMNHMVQTCQIFKTYTQLNSTY